MRYLLLIFIFNLLTAADYDPVFYNFAKKNQYEWGIIVIAFNRPFYLEKMIRSLEKNKESKSIPVFFFLDGGKNARQKENIDLINQASIFKKFINVRKSNYGIVKNHIDAKRFMFDWCGFKKVVVIEEDLIISDHYLTNLINLYDWSKKRFRNLGTVQTWKECLLSRRQKIEQLDLVRETSPFFSFVSYAIDRDVWLDISSLLYEYESQFIDPFLDDDQYVFERSKPSMGRCLQDILKWRDNMLSKIPLYKGSVDKDKKYFKSLYNPKYISHYFNGNQDWLLATVLWSKGYIRLQTSVNRAIHIGQKGFYYTSRPFHLKIQLDQFEEDADLKNFRFKY